MAFSDHTTISTASVSDAYSATHNMKPAEIAVLYDALQMAIRDSFELSRLEHEALKHIAVLLHHETREKK